MSETMIHGEAGQGQPQGAAAVVSEATRETPEYLAHMRSIYEQESYQLAGSIVEAYPHQDLAKAVRREFRESGLHGSGYLQIGETTWWVDARTGEVDPVEIGDLDCESCEGYGEFEGDGVFDYGHVPCRRCDGTGIKEGGHYVSTSERWSLELLRVDDLVGHALRRILHHYEQLPRSFRDDLEARAMDARDKARSER